MAAARSNSGVAEQLCAVGDNFGRARGSDPPRRRIRVWTPYCVSRSARILARRSRLLAHYDNRQRRRRPVVVPPSLVPVQVRTVTTDRSGVHWLDAEIV